MRRLVIAILALLCLGFAAPAAHAQRISALIGEALDKQLPKTDFTFSGTLPQMIQEFGDQTGVRIEAGPAVYDALPWGDLTTVSAHFQHETLRQALAAICQKLGLQFDLADSAVQLRPMPALLRLGRRATVQELQAIDLLASTPLVPSANKLDATKLLEEIDLKLEKSPYAIENRAFDAGEHSTTIALARNATLLDALEEISRQTNATWYPWGKSIVVLGKRDQIRMQLNHHLTTRYDGTDVSQVLLDLAQRSGIDFAIEPGAIRALPAQFRTIKLNLDDATIQQTLESICGFTGLTYTITNDGVKITAPATDSNPPATRPG